MKNASTIAAIALASSLALLATGCDRNEDAATGDTAAMDNQSGTSEMGAPGAVPGTPPDTTTGTDGTMGTDGTAGTTGTDSTLGNTADSAGQAVDDAAITTAIKGKYMADDQLKGLDISVDTEQGVVTLSGQVQNASAKELATQIAQGVEGVQSVNNQLTTQQ